MLWHPNKVMNRIYVEKGDLELGGRPNKELFSHAYRNSLHSNSSADCVLWALADDASRITLCLCSSSHMNTFEREKRADCEQAGNKICSKGINWWLFEVNKRNNSGSIGTGTLRQGRVALFFGNHGVSEMCGEECQTEFSYKSFILILSYR